MKIKKILLVSISIILLSCGESKKWRNSVEESVKKLTETVDQAAKAIPGERWQRILESVHSEDETVRKKALEYLERVTGIKAEKKYAVSVWFEYEDDSSIKIDVFQERFLSRDKARERLDLNRHRLANLRRSIGYPKDVKDLKDTLNKNLSMIFDQIVGEPKAREIPKAPGSMGPPYYNIRNTTDFYDVQLHRVHRKRPDLVLSTQLNKVKEKRAESIEKMVETMLLPINQFSIPLDQNVRREEWNPLEGKGYVYILIKQSDFDRVKDKGFKGYIKVHEKTNSNNSIYSSTDVMFEKVHFNPEISNVVTDPFSKEDYVWYAHDMTGQSQINLVEIQKLGKLLEELEDLKAKQKSEGSSWW